MKTSEMTPETFAANFRKAIRVGFNWDRFFQEAWPIERRTLTTPAALGRCFMPWYIGKTGEEVAFDHPEAAPMSLADVPKATAILNNERQSDIQEYVREFGKQDGVVEFAVPTYAVRDQEFFVLDRNHRLSALTLVSPPFEVTLWNVCGPLDPDCLLDLIHWQPKS
jgi:hypothetical protein